MEEKKYKYKYFISFAYCFGFGTSLSLLADNWETSSTMYNTNKKIETLQDIKEVEETLKAWAYDPLSQDMNCCNVIILNYKLTEKNLPEPIPIYYVVVDISNVKKEFHKILGIFKDYFKAKEVLEKAQNDYEKNYEKNYGELHKKVNGHKYKNGNHQFEFRKFKIFKLNKRELLGE